MENQAAKRPTVLVVEPDPLMLTAMAAVLDSAGLRCTLARSQEVAIAAASQSQFDLMVVSIGEDVLPAAAATAQLRAAGPSGPVPVIFVAPRLDPSWIEPLNAAGGVYCLTRPFEPAKLIELAEQATALEHVSVSRLSPPKAHFAKEWVRLS